MIHNIPEKQIDTLNFESNVIFIFLFECSGFYFSSHTNFVGIDWSVDCENNSEENCFVFNFPKYATTIFVQPSKCVGTKFVFDFMWMWWGEEELIHKVVRTIISLFWACCISRFQSLLQSFNQSFANVQGRVRYSTRLEVFYFKSYYCVCAKLGSLI